MLTLLNASNVSMKLIFAQDYPVTIFLDQRDDFSSLSRSKLSSVENFSLSARGGKSSHGYTVKAPLVRRDRRGNKCRTNLLINRHIT